MILDVNGLASATAWLYRKLFLVILLFQNNQYIFMTLRKKHNKLLSFQKKVQKIYHKAGPESPTFEMLSQLGYQSDAPTFQSSLEFQVRETESSKSSRRCLPRVWSGRGCRPTDRMLPQQSETPGSARKRRSPTWMTALPAISRRSTLVYSFMSSFIQSFIYTLLTNLFMRTLAKFRLFLHKGLFNLKVYSQDVHYI